MDLSKRHLVQEVSSNMEQFNPAMLTIARDSREMTQAELSANSQIPQAVLSKLEGGVARPTQEQIVALAGATHYPPTFFFEQDRIFGFNASVFFHRKRSDMPSKVLKRIHAVLNLTRMRMDKLLLAGNIKPAIELVRMNVEEHGTPELIAQKVRAILQLPDGPIKDLTATLEDAGVIVVQHQFRSRRMDAVSEWVPGHPPIVLMNTDEHVPGDRYRWTLAHELGHLIMHSQQIEDAEEEANRFAAEFLLPERDIRSKLRNVRIQTLALLKGIWKVSMGALLERAKQLGTITLTQYRYMRINFGKMGYTTQEPPELAIPIESPTLMRDLIKLHTSDLSYNISDLSVLLRMEEEECGAIYLPQTGLKLVGPFPVLRMA
jgi:Zn-dependent peptidase ImmA (M78 family)/transcriptional regulator with XRE-family HTH domain